jgi:quercetin dioxygenase-like cupin family protein
MARAQAPNEGNGISLKRRKFNANDDECRSYNFVAERGQCRCPSARFADQRGNAPRRQERKSDAGLPARFARDSRQEHQGRHGRIRTRWIFAVHTHAKSAIIYATVIEGAVRSQVNDGPVVTYRTSQNWTEVPGDHPRVSANASQTRAAKILAVFVVDDMDAELTIPDTR